MARQPKTDTKPEAVATGEEERERIAKRLARAGLCSRRDAEAWIAEGRVSLNGKVVETPATLVGPDDRIEVDGAPLPAKERTRLWLYHKPAGLVTTARDPEGRPTVFASLPDGMPRVLSVGRLDINTEGLLLLTNDGGLARVLELPQTGWLRRYRVRALGDVSQEALDKLKEGIAVDGVLYGPIEAALDRRQGSNVWITMAFREGKNREVKNVLGALGLTVNRLIRVSYGPFQLGEMAEGEVREIKGRYLRDQLGDRLIEDAQADFDAPVLHHIAGAKDADEEKPAGRARAEKPERKFREKRGAGQAGEAALDRLDTRKRSGGERRDGDRKPARRSDGKPQTSSEGRKPFSRAKDGGRPEQAAGGERKPRFDRKPRPEGTADAASAAPAREAERPARGRGPAKPGFGKSAAGKPAFRKPEGEGGSRPGRREREATKSSGGDVADSGEREFKRRPRPEGAARSDDRPRKDRDFSSGGKREDKPSGGRDFKPRGDRPPRREGSDAGKPGGRPPFRKREDDDAAKPGGFRRREEAGEGGAEAPKRTFSRKPRIFGLEPGMPEPELGKPAGKKPFGKPGGRDGGGRGGPGRDGGKGGAGKPRGGPRSDSRGDSGGGSRGGGSGPDRGGRPGGRGGGADRRR